MKRPDEGGFGSNHKVASYGEELKIRVYKPPVTAGDWGERPEIGRKS